MTGLGLFQALGKALTSFILSILRQVLIFIPLVLILPNIDNIGILGIWISFPISDFLSAIITILVYKKQLGNIFSENNSSISL
jgi:Na+-driven multidrug efflux pump